MVQASKLTEKLTVQYLSVSANTYGAPIDIWFDVKTIWASVVNQRGSNNFKPVYEGDIYSDSISFYCRFLNLDKKGIRIKRGDEIYEVVNLTHIQRRSATVIDCVSVK